MASRVLSKYKSNAENIPAYEKLSFMDIRQITRKICFYEGSMITDPKSLDQNMGVISSIKGKMYCLKLGEVSSSKDFSHYFYSKQFKVKKDKPEPLRRISSNSMYSQLIPNQSVDIWYLLLMKYHIWYYFWSIKGMSENNFEKGEQVSSEDISTENITNEASETIDDP